MKDLKLTAAERLILANQFEILGAIKGDADSTRLAENIRDGHAYLYMERLSSSLQEDLPLDQQNHVLDILEIYDFMKSSYEDFWTNEAIDKSALDFPGFDGNNEGELLRFAQALAEDGRYVDTIGQRAKNSHGQTTEIYQRMIDAYQDMGKPGYPLSAEQIQTILDSRIHPSNKA